LLFFAAVGLLLEASFFVYATWATFYNPSFYTEDDAPHLWSFILGMMGTFSLMCGMSLCARLVERRSTERRFKRRDRPGEAKPRIFWLQCGDQRVGDQQFRSFAYSEEKKQYMTSFIHKPDSLPIFGLPPRFVLWAAIVSSLLGFACQFVGFRGLHGSIILYQLACTLIMAGVRAGLRSRRLERKKNRLESFHRWSESDELDWQALSIVGDDYPLKNAGQYYQGGAKILWQFLITMLL
jgi:peptidoglycan/LPS O-acetylase OafA/YrhL